MSGTSLRAVQEILGHKTLAMVQRYAHLSSSHPHDAVGRIALGGAAAAHSRSETA